MKLAPRIIQAMEILQLPMMALQERIDAEMESNPVLELRSPETEEQAPAEEREDVQERGEHQMVVDEDSDNSEDFNRLAEFEAEYGPESVLGEAVPYFRVRDDGGGDRKLEAMANAPAPSESLNEYLLGQWAFVEADEPVKNAGLLIINYIDDDGYLRMPLEELAVLAPGSVTPETLREALRLVQTLEPIGVGARDLKECLGLQLAADAAAGKDVSLEMELVERFLRDIEMNHLPQIAKRTGRTLEQIKTGIENLSRLDPRPGSLIGQRTAPVIRPDVVVEVEQDGGVIVTMSDGNTPRLRISRGYRRLIRDRKTDKQAKQFIQNSIRSAQWLIGAIRQRRETIRRVAEEVFKVQRDFLESGRESLKPLPMADVADKLGVHVATISRAVAGKHVQTPRGIYPLRMFFSGGTTTADGRDVAWDAVRVKLKELIDAEDKSAPLDDGRLAAELKAHGIDIARRTVAKYRNLLNIPPGRKRRQY